MYRFYKKNEENFAIFWIITYVLLMGISENLSAKIGVEKLISAPVAVILTEILYLFIRKNGLKEKYGLCSFRGKPGDYLYFLPLIALVSTNLWAGVQIKLGTLEILLFIITMLSVGFLEEIIFRGFLFKALSRKNLRQAVIISSLTFGIGHIVNLLNGAPLFSTLLQICYAVAIGFLFTILFLRSGCLWPCIFAHSAINTLSVVGGEGGILFNTLTAVFLCLCSLLYSFWILKKTRKIQ